MTPAPKALTVRLSPAQQRDLENMARKLHISKTDVIRLAITRLAEQELPARRA